MKSTAMYPDKKQENFISVFYEDSCDFNLIKHYRVSEGFINTKPSNSSQILGKAPNVRIECLIKCLIYYL